MVGIVVVSHSRALAQAAVALAGEMLPVRALPIVVAAGMDDGTFGTDAARIAEAVTEADVDGTGVVVLMDLGSAVLSAELALELLADDVRARVLLCPAPLVEGLVVAAVTAHSGAGPAEVAAEAVGSLAAKQAHLRPSPAPTPLDPAPLDPAPLDPARTPIGAETGRFRVTATHGLHARPAARLVQALHGLDARVELRNLTTDSSWVPGASLSRLATLDARRGHDVEVRATGPQAHTAVAHLLALAGRNFDEAMSPASGPPPVNAPDRAEGPFPASPGIGVGPARLFVPAGAEPSAGETAGDAEAEQDRLSRAISLTHQEVRSVRDQVAKQVGEAEAAIFDPYRALLADPELLADARSRIEAGQSAVQGWSAAISVAVAGLSAVLDPYLQARAADIQALGNQVLARLHGSREPAVTLAPPGDLPGVLVAADLTPAQAAVLDPDRVTAVVLAFGSPTAHSVILARARGIPAVVAAGAAVLRIAEGTLLAVDGDAGDLVIAPPAEVLARFRERAQAVERQQRQARADAGSPARTRDGVRIMVGANVGSIRDARAAAESGADHAGLVRTEFLFLGRDQAPGVVEQEEVYRALARELPGRRVTFRTLDVGGDKPLAFLSQPVEANPFLGVRGLRLGLRHPHLLADQLAAIVAIAHEGPTSVMFPMVSTVDELIAARRMLDGAIEQVGRGTPAGLQVGIMVEVPAAALKTAVFAPHVDFFSLGTNDLAQYALAAERGNAALAALSDALDPGVLRLVEATCRGAGPGARVAVCGELAADARAVPLLAGLGVQELSVTPGAVAGVKRAVRALDLSAAAALARRALDAPSASAVRDLLAAADHGAV